MFSVPSVVESILSNYNGAVMCRQNRQTFIAVPTGNETDGVPTYIKIAVSNLLAKQTATCEPFNVERAHAEYEQYAKEQAERENAPKKGKTVNAEAEAKRTRQNDRITLFFETEAEADHAYTATDLFTTMMDDFATVMEVGSTMNRLADSGLFTVVMDGKKKTYIKA